MIRRKKTVSDAGQSQTATIDAVNSDIPNPGVPLKSPAALLGEILLEERIVTSEQLEEALAKRKEDGGFLGQALVELGHIDQDTLTLVLVKQCKIPHLNLLDYQLDDTIAKLIPRELCERHHILPIDKMGKILTVAMVDPLNIEALEAIRSQYPDLRIKPILCNWNHFNTVYGKVFNESPNGADSEEGDDDSWAGLNIPKAPPKKPDSAESKSASNVGEGGLGALISDVLGASAASFIVGLLENSDADTSAGEELADTLRDGMEDRMPEIVQAMREEMGALVTASGSDVTQNEDFAELSKKIELLTHSVTQIAQASEAYQSVRKREEREVAETFRQDLQGRNTKLEHGVAELAESAGGPSRDELVKAELDTGAPLHGYSFDSFFVGAANQLTCDICKTTAENPGGQHNPLFVCGDVGLGKTHLINAIGNYIVEKSPETRVGYTSASRFASHVLTSHHQGMQNAFREAYCQWDVLILDDIQFLGGKIQAQEEMFHVFNALQQEGRQIIIAADKPPRKLGLLEQRLVSRFEGGLVVSLKSPEWETRVEILRYRSEKLQTDVPEEVLKMMAMRIPNDMRRLIGAFIKIVTIAEIEGEAVTSPLADRVLTEDAEEEVA